MALKTSCALLITLPTKCRRRHGVTYLPDTTKQLALICFRIWAAAMRSTRQVRNEPKLGKYETNPI